MPASFSVSQSGATPNSVTVTDTSTGLPGSIVKRRIFISNAYSEYLTGNGTVNYDEWALANTSFTYSDLTESIGALIKVQWLDVSNAVIAEEEDTYGLSQISKQFFYYLLQLQGLTPGVYQDTNYSGNLALLWSNIIGGDNAITYGNDLSAAQNCYNRCTEFQNNQTFYF